MSYQYTEEEIDYDKLPANLADRIQPLVKMLLDENNYVVDLHTHYFDMKCINKAYFLLRSLKDLVGLKSGEEDRTSFSEEAAYMQSTDYEENWEDELKFTLSDAELQFIDPNKPTKGFIDIIHARKFLGMKTMEDVYWHYIQNFSLAKQFTGVPEKNVITSVLMMDLETGWGLRGKINKTLHKQIDEVKEMAKNFPVLPFLACDPRRAEFPAGDENLYTLFNEAFCKGFPFFGVKIYPALGYYPSDYRLWPIYEICEKIGLPVISHHGGETVSTSARQLNVYHGKEKVLLTAPNRKEMAYSLNDPAHWKIVLESFPNLKLNFGHFGGYATWSKSIAVDITKDPQKRKETIFSFMEKYPNVYADFSFNIEDEKNISNLKNVIVNNDLVLSRTMFGSDYWVVNPQGNLNEMQENFVEIMNNSFEELELPKKLCVDNPTKFLFG